MKEPRLKTLMTPFPYSVSLDAPIGEARRLMRDHGVRHLPVKQEATLVGLITDRDIKLRLGALSERRDIGHLTVRDVLVDDCYSVDIDAPLLPVLRHMAEHHIGSAVVTSHGRLAGIFTTTDALHAFAAHLQVQFHPGEDDPPDAA